MALLVEGEAMSPEEMKEFLNFIRQHGINQFLNIWKRAKDLQDDELKFGDEVECGVFVVDHQKKTVKLSIRGAEVIFLTKLITSDFLNDSVLSCCIVVSAAVNFEGKGGSVFT